MTFKKLEMDKTLKNGVKYDWNESPQPQMVGFCDLVGTDTAPVSKKTAVKIEFQNTPWLQEKGKDIESIQLKVTYIVHHAISKVISKVKRYKLLSCPYKENT